MKASEKYLVDMGFASTTHGRVGCIVCHKGVASADPDIAHQGLIRDPSDRGTGIGCAVCHAKTTETFNRSLHYTLRGYRTNLDARSQSGSTERSRSLSKVFIISCWTGCHTTCGQCHISRPKTAKGGLYEKHAFSKEPPMDKACYGCHGARNAGDYLGLVNQPPDAHYKKKKMTCSGCHKIENLHGVSGDPKTMFDAQAKLPTCESCHKKVLGKKSKIEAHKAHDENVLACQVCHSSRYNTCYGCHLTPDGKGGYTSSSQIVSDFKIGLNPEQTKERPYKFVIVRHVPTARDSFDAYTSGLLPNYDSVPTWKYSPVHNIRKITAQNEKCNFCHGQPNLFLKESDLKPGDSEANRKVVVPKIPKAITKK